MIRLDNRPADGGPSGSFDDPAHLGRVLARRVLPVVSAPARYVGGELGADPDGWAPDKANILLTFPDAYEVGMSHQGLRILHTLLQRHGRASCDIAFAPWPDMERAMRAEGLPLYGLNTRRSARQFDLVGFSLGYELAYTNMLTMIDLAGAPLLAKDRGEGDPIFVAGGSCAMNPAVIGPFLDLVLLGDGEEAVLDFATIIADAKRERLPRAELLARLRGVEGAWHENAAGPVRARVLQDLNAYPPPGRLVPVIEPVHDRLALEVMRGCVRGCRFCQAGMITRPVRERDPGQLVEAAVRGMSEAGYDEISLLSLSTGDYSGLGSAVAGIQDSFTRAHTNVVLPSLRLDSVDDDLYDRIGREKPSSFTFAPEAGSQRLRDVINKNITEDDVVTTAGQALRAGVKTVKLYFMIGLPTETNEDLDELVALVGRVVGLAPRGGAQVHVSISPFSPKAHTTFQWAGQIAREEIERRNQYLEKRLRRMKVKVSLRDPSVSALEGILGLGDAALAPAVVEAWRQGARFDGWDEHFHFATWERAFAAVGVDPAAYLAPRDPQAPLPWDSVDCGVDRSFLAKDWHRAQRAATLHDCRLEGSCYNCAACDGDIQHIFAKLEALQAEAPGDQVEGPAVVADRDDPAEVPSFDPRNADPEDPAQEAAKWRAWRHQAAAKCWYRVEYRKTGDLIFLGHLDFQRQFQLALRRSGLPAAYSKGYHPHPLMRFGPPLPVGVAGERECLDIAFEGQVPGWVQRLNAELPADLMIRRAVVIGGQAPAAIDQLVERFDYRVQLPPEAWGGPDAGTVAAAIDGFLASASWPCVRRRAKGDLEIDARVLVPTGGLALEPDPAGDGAPVLRVTLLRGDGGVILPVHDFLAALLGEALAEPRFSAITRTGIHGRQQDGRWLSPVEEVGESGLRTWLARQHAD